MVHNQYSNGLCKRLEDIKQLLIKRRHPLEKAITYLTQILNVVPTVEHLLNEIEKNPTQELWKKLENIRITTDTVWSETGIYDITNPVDELDSEIQEIEEDIKSCFGRDICLSKYWDLWFSLTPKTDESICRKTFPSSLKHCHDMLTDILQHDTELERKMINQSHIIYEIRRDLLCMKIKSHKDDATIDGHEKQIKLLENKIHIERNHHDKVQLELTHQVDKNSHLEAMILQLTDALKTSERSTTSLQEELKVKTDSIESLTKCVKGKDEMLIQCNLVISSLEKQMDQLLHHTKGRTEELIIPTEADQKIESDDSIILPLKSDYSAHHQDDSCNSSEVEEESTTITSCGSHQYDLLSTASTEVSSSLNDISDTSTLVGASCETSQSLADDLDLATHETSVINRRPYTHQHYPDRKKLEEGSAVKSTHQDRLSSQPTPLPTGDMHEADRKNDVSNFTKTLNVFQYTQQFMPVHRMISGLVKLMSDQLAQDQCNPIGIENTTANDIKDDPVPQKDHGRDLKEYLKEEKPPPSKSHSGLKQLKSLPCDEWRKHRRKHVNRKKRKQNTMKWILLNQRKRMKLKKNRTYIMSMILVMFILNLRKSGVFLSCDSSRPSLIPSSPGRVRYMSGGTSALDQGNGKCTTRSYALAPLRCN